MRNILAGTIIVFLSIAGCQASQQATQYEKRIGDIDFDPKSDDKNFELCYPNTIQQYFAFTSDKCFTDYKPYIDSVFFASYRSIPLKESGLIRIRFVVNCKGQTDRFRLLAMNMRYEPMRFNKRITSQLLSIIKSIKVWQVQMVNGQPVDYYQYLIFKIRNGQLIEILP
ncbi:hypothetical protein U0035_09220 [Niabella yanshanensis]|uniref:TonB C-terminal domain-containing protein n=1 Tax=Niabella yanshanensis TaxID=577386 RepID=A0ABZ0WAK0_9BACT|nr:hypothetical protein [Niabella yanshanensis]WQD40323.1 hypothetical protein U0035_09220 [Niabella yanshanensis]